MWESRVLCEMSKSLWEALFAFHRDDIVIAVFVVARRVQAPRGGSPQPVLRLSLRAPPTVIPELVSYSRARHLATDHRRRLDTKGPGA